MQKIDLFELSGDKNEVSTKIGEMLLVNLTESKNTMLVMRVKVPDKLFFVKTEELYNILK